MLRPGAINGCGDARGLHSWRKTRRAQVFHIVDEATRGKARPRRRYTPPAVATHSAQRAGFWRWSSIATSRDPVLKMKSQVHLWHVPLCSLHSAASLRRRRRAKRHCYAAWAATDYCDCDLERTGPVAPRAGRKFAGRSSLIAGSRLAPPRGPPPPRAAHLSSIDPEAAAPRAQSAMCHFAHSQSTHIPHAFHHHIGVGW